MWGCLMCNHESSEICSENKCDFYCKSPWVCYDRYHGLDSSNANLQDKKFLSKPLSSEKGDCPVDDSSYALEKLDTCFVHEEIRNPQEVLCLCDIRILMGAGCQCGGS